VSDVCGRVCPDNRLVSCARDPGHGDGWCAGRDKASGMTHRWTTDGLPVDWDQLGWFKDPEPLSKLSDDELRDIIAIAESPWLGLVVTGALIVMVLGLAAVAVALVGVL